MGLSKDTKIFVQGHPGFGRLFSIYEDGEGTGRYFCPGLKPVKDINVVGITSVDLPMTAIITQSKQHYWQLSSPLRTVSSYVPRMWQPGEKGSYLVADEEGGLFFDEATWLTHGFWDTYPLSTSGSVLCADVSFSFYISTIERATITPGTDTFIQVKTAGSSGYWSLNSDHSIATWNRVTIDSCEMRYSDGVVSDRMRVALSSPFPNLYFKTGMSFPSTLTLQELFDNYEATWEKPT